MAFVLNVLVIIGVMWVLFRFMYPKPKDMYLPKSGDDVSVRPCNYCQTPLATYRGILIPKSLPADTEEAALDYTFSKDDKGVITDDCWFFCNQEHQASFASQQAGIGIEVDKQP